MPRVVEYKIGNGAWTPLGRYDRSLQELSWRPPKSGTYLFRQREFDAEGRTHETWGYSQPLEVVLSPPGPILQSLPADECPPADRASPGRLWLTPEGPAYIGDEDPFSVSAPSDVGVDGVNGGIWFTSASNTYSKHSTQDILFITPTDQSISSDLLASGLASGRSARVGNVQYNFTGTLDILSLSIDQYEGNTYRGYWDLKPELETDLGVGIRHSSGATLYCQIEDPQHPEDSPYNQANASTNATVVGAASVKAFFQLGTSGSFSFFLFRWSKRCEHDPLSPWLPHGNFVGGKDGRGLEFLHFVAATDDALPDADVPPNTLVYDAPRDAQGVDSGHTIGGTTYYDDPRPVSAATPWRGYWVRTVPGLPVRGAVPTAEWGNWAGPFWSRDYADDGTDGSDFLTETIWAATTEDALTSAQMPDDAWTLGQKGTRSGVVWESSLEAAGFSLDKEYGWRAYRQYKRGAANGSAVSDPWHTTLDAHFGISALGGALSRFVYHDIGAITNAGGYQFFEGGSATQRSGTNVNGDWSKIIDADWVEVGTKDKDGWPVLEWADLDSDSKIVYEPNSSQWVAYDVAAVHEITGGYRLQISKARVSDGGGADIPLASGNAADFYLSVPRREKPGFQGSAHYDPSIISTGTTASNGYFAFHSGTAAVSSANRIAQFGDAIKTATRLVIASKDEHGNAFDSLAAVVVGDVIVAEVTGTRNWAAWEVTAISGNTYSIKLDSYRVNRGASGYPSRSEVVFGVPHFIPPSADTFGIRVVPIDNQNTSAAINWRAFLSGTALDGTPTPIPTFTTNFDADGERNPDGFASTTPEYAAVTKIATGRITLPTTNTTNRRVLFEVQARLPGRVVRDDEFFQLGAYSSGGGGGGVTPPPAPTKLTPPTFTAVGGVRSIVVTRGDLPTGAASWAVQWNETALGTTNQATVASSETTYTIDELANGRAYNIRTGSVAAADSTSYTTSDWSASQTVITRRLPQGATNVRLDRERGHLVVRWVGESRADIRLVQFVGSGRRTADERPLLNWTGSRNNIFSYQYEPHRDTTAVRAYVRVFNDVGDGPVVASGILAV